MRTGVRGRGQMPLPWSLGVALHACRNVTRNGLWPQVWGTGVAQHTQKSIDTYHHAEVNHRNLAVLALHASTRASTSCQRSQCGGEPGSESCGVPHTDFTEVTRVPARPERARRSLPNVCRTVEESVQVLFSLIEGGVQTLDFWPEKSKQDQQDQARLIRRLPRR